MNHNHATIVGRLVKDPELQATKSGTSIARMNVAIDESVKKNGSYEKVPAYIPVVAFGKTAETIAQYAKKGQMMMFIGKISIKNYQKDGIWKTDASVICDTFQFGPKSGERRDTVQEDTGEVSDDNELEEDEINLEDVPF